MARITLESILKAAWSLHLAGALPNPGVARVERIVDEGGMRPWLQLALPAADVAALYADGKAAWHMAALLGLDEHPEPVLTCPRGQAPFIRFVEGLCSDADSSIFSFLAAEKERVEAYGDPLVRSFLVFFEFSRGGNPAYPLIVKTFRAIAESFGIDLSTVKPADLSAWSERTVEATITSRRGQPDTHAFHAVEALTEDGHVIQVGNVHHVDSAVGGRIHVTLRGATAYHPGYAIGYSRDENVRLMDDVDRRLSLVASATEVLASPEGSLAAFADILAEAMEPTTAVQTEVAATDPGISAVPSEARPVAPAAMAATDVPAAGKCISADGRELEVNDFVVVTCDHLEARKGTMGAVFEIVGDTAYVLFDDVEGLIPCPGHLLTGVLTNLRRAA